MSSPGAKLQISGLDPQIVRVFKSRAALEGLSQGEYFARLVRATGAGDLEQLELRARAQEMSWAPAPPEVIR